VHQSLCSEPHLHVIFAVDPENSQILSPDSKTAAPKRSACLERLGFTEESMPSCGNKGAMLAVHSDWQNPSPAQMQQLLQQAVVHGYFTGWLRNGLPGYTLDATAVAAEPLHQDPARLLALAVAEGRIAEAAMPKWIKIKKLRELLNKRPTVQQCSQGGECWAALVAGCHVGMLPTLREESVAACMDYRLCCAKYSGVQNGRAQTGCWRGSRIQIPELLNCSQFP
jgi:hypothetical protein